MVFTVSERLYWMLPLSVCMMTVALCSMLRQLSMSVEIHASHFKQPDNESSVPIDYSGSSVDYCAKIHTSENSQKNK